MTGPQRHDELKVEGNQSLSNALSLIDVLRASHMDKGVRELSRELGLAPSIVHRLLVSLRERNYVEQDPVTTKYRVSARIFNAAGSLPPACAFLDKGMIGKLTQFAQHVGMDGYVGVMRGNSVIYVATTATRFTTADATVGDQTYLHTTALGKALLAGLESRKLNTIARMIDLTPRTDRSIVSTRNLMQEIKAVQRDDVAFCRGENLENIFAIGVPLRNDENHTVASVSFATQEYAHFMQAQDIVTQYLREKVQAMFPMTGSVPASF
ncbi:IclR family transcriptional regulator [Novacetimonas hansenii]|uniref:Helix-turn-helix domain-containing protein n=1 Tax=Novacetimonas hansenii TaxID=436 RepID=A0AAW5ERE8_NOVHA|nr:IclR family transcriptional regulator C-terminal domain-containing protein [Novacetimonas hansenii]MCJ8353895.1 helix-turn-helix domain-containing protein [Novacetimonas hansenii]